MDDDDSSFASARMGPTRWTNTSPNACDSSLGLSSRRMRDVKRGYNLEDWIESRRIQRAPASSLRRTLGVHSNALANVNVRIRGIELQIILERQRGDSHELLGRATTPSPCN